MQMTCIQYDIEQEVKVKCVSRNPFDDINVYMHKKPLKTVWPDCKAATKFEKIDWEQA